MANKKTSIRAKLAEGLLWSLNLKKDFVSKENANLYIEKRYTKNDHDIRLPRMKNPPVNFIRENLEVFVYNKYTKGDKLIVYFHGGAYNSGPLSFHFKYLETLHKKTKVPIILPIYPKAPKYTYKDAYNLLEKAYKEIVKLNYHEIIFMGDSAGGGLALGMTQKLKKLKQIIPNKIILFSPWLDLTMENPLIDSLESLDPMISKVGLQAMANYWANGTSLNNYLLSPTFGDLDNFPETTIFVGTHEIFLPDIRLFKEKLIKANVKTNYYEYKGLNHVFVLYPIPEAKEALKIVVENIK